MPENHVLLNIILQMEGRGNVMQILSGLNDYEGTFDCNAAIESL